MKDFPQSTWLIYRNLYPKQPQHRLVPKTEITRPTQTRNNLNVVPKTEITKPTWTVPKTEITRPTRTWNNLTPVWTVLCLVRSFFLTKDLSHSSQGKGFLTRSECAVSRCCFKPEALTYFLPQSSQGIDGRESAEWRREWAAKSHFWGKDFGQEGHWNGFSSEGEVEIQYHSWINGRVGGMI